ncbi:MAG: glycosyltransferase [Bacteroidota bacterium]
MAALDLSVIIVNYNVKHYLDQCILAAERALHGLKGEIIVIDNVSQDGSQDFLREKFADRITFIANTENVGFSKGNNQGIAIAKGKYVLLLNPDTLVGEESFQRCFDFMEAHPEAGGLGVRMIDGRGQFLPESKRGLPTPWVSFYKIFGLSKLFPKNRRFGQYHLSYLDAKETHEVQVLSGAYMWMRKELLDEIGYLDETFFMYGEDIDLSYRINLGGKKNYYFAGTRILHYKGESTKKGSLNYVRVFYQAMIIFAKKHFGGGNKKVFIGVINLAVYLRALLAIFSRLIKRIGFPILEWGMVYGLMLGITAYWEHYVKYIVGGNYYPPLFRFGYLPVYALIFILFLWIAGAYRKPYRLRPLLTAPLSAFIAIATVTYMFEGVLNFSRAIVGLSAVFTSLLTLTTRGIQNLRGKGSFFFTELKQQRAVLIVEDADKKQALDLLLGKLSYPSEIVGTVSLSQTQPSETKALVPTLGSLPQLKDILSLYQVQEVIFMQDALPATLMLEVMDENSRQALDFYIIPPQADYLIGPHLIHTSRYGQDLNLRLKQPSALREKRAFDWIGSSLLLLSFPLLFWRYASAGKALHALTQSWLGQTHLVGYSQNPNQDLPPLKKAWLHPKERLSSQSSGLNIEALNRLYAQHYHWSKDLEVVWNSWTRLGQ